MFSNPVDAARELAIQSVADGTYQQKLEDSCLCATFSLQGQGTGARHFKIGVCDRCLRCTAWGTVRVRVFWSQDNAWYQGCILRATANHRITLSYDDGQREALHVTEATANDVLMEQSVVWAEWECKPGKPPLWWPAIVLSPYDFGDRDKPHADQEVMVQLCANLGSIQITGEQTQPFCEFSAPGGNASHFDRMVTKLRDSAQYFGSLRVKPQQMTDVLLGEQEKQLSACHLVDIAIAEGLSAHLAFTARESQATRNGAVRCHYAMATEAAKLATETFPKLSYLATPDQCCSWYMQHTSAADGSQEDSSLDIDAQLASKPWRDLMQPSDQVPRTAIAQTAFGVMRQMLRHSVLRLETLWSCCELMSVISCALSSEETQPSVILQQIKAVLSNGPGCRVPTELPKAISTLVTIPKQQPRGKQAKKQLLAPPPPVKKDNGTTQVTAQADSSSRAAALKASIKWKGTAASCGRFQHKPDCQCHINPKISKSSVVKQRPLMRKVPPSHERGEPKPKVARGPPGSGCGRYNHKPDCQCHLASSYKSRVKRPGEDADVVAAKRPRLIPLEEFEPEIQPEPVVQQQAPVDKEQQVNALLTICKLLCKRLPDPTRDQPSPELLHALSHEPRFSLPFPIPDVRLDHAAENWGKWHCAGGEVAQDGLLDATLDISLLAWELQRACRNLDADVAKRKRLVQSEFRPRQSDPTDFTPKPEGMETPLMQLSTQQLQVNSLSANELHFAVDHLQRLEGARVAAQQNLDQISHQIDVQKQFIQELQARSALQLLLQVAEMSAIWLRQISAQMFREGAMALADDYAAARALEKIKLIRWLCKPVPLQTAIGQNLERLTLLCTRSLHQLTPPPRPVGSTYTAVVYSSQCLGHRVPSQHMEQPARQSKAMQLINETIGSEMPDEVIVLQSEAKAISPISIRCVHTALYLSQLQSLCAAAGAQGCLLPLNPESGDLDTVVSADSYNAALHGSGAVCQAVSMVIAGEARNAFCCVRPPGHHAGRDGLALGEASQGFCLLNNVAIGMVHARLQAPWLTRLAVVDFDVHHGNGTEEIVAGDLNTFFASVHRHGQGFFPANAGAAPLHPSMNLHNIPLSKGFDGSAFR